MITVSALLADSFCTMLSAISPASVVLIFDVMGILKKGGSMYWVFLKPIRLPSCTIAVLSMIIGAIMGVFSPPRSMCMGRFCMCLIPVGV